MTLTDTKETKSGWPDHSVWEIRNGRKKVIPSLPERAVWISLKVWIFNDDYLVRNIVRNFALKPFFDFCDECAQITLFGPFQTIEIRTFSDNWNPKQWQIVVPNKVGVRWLVKRFDFWMVRILGLSRSGICNESLDFGPRNSGHPANTEAWASFIWPTVP